MSQLWMIERDVTEWTDEQIAAGGVRAKMCILWYSDMQWIRSFFDREGQRLLCVYQAESEDDIRTHAEMAGLPCGTVLPVEEVLPSDLDEPTEGDMADHAREMERPPVQVELAERV